MSWLRSSPLRQSFNRNSSNNAPFFMSNPNAPPTFSATPTAVGTNGTALRQRPIDTATDCDPRACYDSFCKHWQQAYDIIQRAENAQKPPNHDEVLAVVSHLDFMVTLLLVELHHCNKIKLPTAEAAPPAAPCLEYMLSENLLYKLYEWGCSTGRYANAVLLEQLKLYELLVSHSRHQLLCHEPFLRPLLKILAASQGEIFPPDLEKRLVILLNQLCVVLMQNVHLLDLFFFSAAQEQHKLINGSEARKNGASTNFIIFSLLIPYVHRAGSLGHQARDALLLCMALSQKNSNIGTYIAQYSSMCPLLVTGLGGLYSRLPNSIEITSVDWHRITPDDVTEIPELTLFMNALEFCNAVVQVAHDMIKSQLLDFMYQGFIVPVLGPAILQTLKGKHFQTNVDSQISAMSYLDLILRSVTENDLLRLFVRFLLDTEKFDGERIIDILIERLSSNDPNLCMVTMALFDTLLGLHCEDLMLDLLLKYMLPGKHVPISYRHKINKVDPYTKTADYFLELTPDVMKRARELTKHKSLGDTVNTAQPQPQQTAYPMMPSPTTNMSKTIGANWNYYGLLSGDSLYSNYHAYLFEAHQRISQCQAACSKWRNTYKYQKWPTKMTQRSNAMLDMVKQFFNEFSTSPLAELTVAATGTITVPQSHAQFVDTSDKKQLDSLQSIGESSGYESFKWRPTDEEAESTDAATENSTASDNQIKLQIAKREPWRVSQNHNELLLTDLDFSEDLFAQGTINLGPFINAIWGKLQTFTSNSLYVNLHLTGLITRLAWYPLPLIHSILLRPDIVITSDTPSFLQMVRILKQQIDAELPVAEFSLEIVDVARSHLIDREFRLLNARKASENSPAHITRSNNGVSGATGQQNSAYANLSANSPVQVTPSSNYDPFKRADSKRKSISKSISSMFNRGKNASSGFSQIYAFFTGGSTFTPFNNNNNNDNNGSNNQPTVGGNATQSTATTNNSNSSSDSNTHETSLSTTQSTITTATTAASANALDVTERVAAPTYVANYTQFSNSSQTASLGSLGSSNATLSNASSVITLQASSNSTATGAAAAVSGGSEPVSLESLSSMGAIANTSGTERTRDLALCAVLLDEWLKELAAIAQEQSIVLLEQ